MTFKTEAWNNVYKYSAYSIMIVVSSMLFSWVGRQIDIAFKCEPTFMIGLLILSICLCIFRLFKEIKN